MRAARLIKQAPRTLVLLALTAALSVSHTALADAGNYRVEILVFRHVYTDEQAMEVDSVRGFHDLLELTEETLPGSDRDLPLMLNSRGGTFDDIRRRLARMDAYEPLAILIYEQNRVDYHPPVRVHNDLVIAEELHFPGNVFYIDLDDENMLAPFLMPMYQLDGSVQLRRSRFLHIDLDLEFREEDPAWAAAYPPLNPEVSPESPTTDLFSVDEVLSEEPPEPFRVFRLQQSRQIRTGSINYFDTPFLGAMVRVTATQETP